MRNLLISLFLLSATAFASGLNVSSRPPIAAAVSHQWVNSISASGATTLSQPNYTDLAGSPPAATVIYAAPTTQRFTSGTGTYNLDYTFVVSSASATVGATYTNNSITFTVYATVASSTQVVMSGSGAPLSSGTLTKASGTGDSTITFSQVLKPLYLEVVAVGGGAGGTGSGTAAFTSGAGGNTTFGSSLITSNGAAGSAGGGGANGISGAGGASVIASPAIIVSSAAGGTAQGWDGFTPLVAGTTGCSSPLGGAGAGSAANVLGVAAAVNSGSGGGGAGSGSGGTNSTGIGGSCGGYSDAIIPNPSATYGFAVGAAGTAGAAGASGTAGGAGGSGVINVKESYQ